MDWRSLPVDLQKEILSRVPATSLARLRSTSKQWNALLKSANIHSTNAPKESLIIMLEYFRVFLVRANYLHELDISIAPSVNVTSQFYLEDPQFKSSQVDIRKVFLCDGLLLCSTEDDRLVKYKVLRVDHQGHSRGINNEYEIYDFTTDSWRVLGPKTDWYLPLSHCGVSVKGNTYWIALHRGTP
ncbi:unnamed protein product, partial [Arabidopsis halleri]